jgi:hypothetical protein
MAQAMSGGRMIELAAAVLILVAGLVLYRRRDKVDSYGSQGAVLLFAIAAIMGVHALGGLDYRPSPAEADMLKGQGR